MMEGEKKLEFRNPEFEDAINAIPHPPDVSHAESSEELLAAVMPYLVGMLALENCMKTWTDWIRANTNMIEKMKTIEDRQEQRIKEAVQMERAFRKEDE